MATLLQATDPVNIPVGHGHLTVRPATSLERDIAAETAAGWATAIIAGIETHADFGVPDGSLAALTQRWAEGERDILAMANSLITIALARICVTEIVDVSRKDGDVVRPVRIDKADLAHLLKDDALKGQVHDALLRPFYQMVAVGNGSAPGSSTNSGADS